MRSVLLGLIAGLLLLANATLLHIARYGVPTFYPKGHVLLLRPAVSTSGESGLIGSVISLEVPE
jgi:hypothetical protein